MTPYRFRLAVDLEADSAYQAMMRVAAILGKYGITLSSHGYPEEVPRV